MKMRKILSFFYDQRLKAKAWRKYSHITSQRGLHKLTFTAYLEQRIDVLLVRSGFATTIFNAKRLVQKGHISVSNQLNVVTNPTYVLKPFEIFRIRKGAAIIQRRFFTLKKHTAIMSSRKEKVYTPTFVGLTKPTYLWIHYGLLFAFLMENVTGLLVSYPFALQSGHLGAFRKSFNVLYS